MKGELLNVVTVLFWDPFVINVVRPSQSGKTFWMERLLHDLDELVSVPIYTMGLFKISFNESKVIMT